MTYCLGLHCFDPHKVYCRKRALPMWGSMCASCWHTLGVGGQSYCSRTTSDWLRFVGALYGTRSTSILRPHVAAIFGSCAVSDLPQMFAPVGRCNACCQHMVLGLLLLWLYRGLVLSSTTQTMRQHGCLRLGWCSILVGCFCFSTGQSCWAAVIHPPSLSLPSPPSDSWSNSSL